MRNNVQAAEIWIQLDQEEIQQRALVNTVMYFRIRGRRFIDKLSDCQFAQSVPNVLCLLFLSSAFTISQTMFGTPSTYCIQNPRCKLWAESHFRAVPLLTITIPTLMSPKSKLSITSLNQHTDSCSSRKQQMCVT